MAGRVPAHDGPSTSPARLPQGLKDARDADCHGRVPPAVVVIGPVRVYRELLASELDTRPGITVVGAGANTKEALGPAADPPDVILLDASPQLGVDAIRTMVGGCPTARLVALPAPEDDAGILAWAAAGVAGFVAGNSTLDEIVTAAKAVAHGDIVCPPRVTAALLRWAGTGAPGGPAEPTVLTSRERQVLRLIDGGLSNKEIATKLYIEVSTVKNHVHNILAKLGARRRAEAAALARVPSRSGDG
ncbi:MAG: hypothetical protein QG622_3446 [Actinomycetota bacterium]|nr:hypothetical protein [Actinomycetota bacterium]